MKLAWLASLCAAALLPAPIFADASIYLSPEQLSLTVGQPVEIRVLADTNEQHINAAEAEIAFDPALFEAGEIRTDSSVLITWPTPASFTEPGVLRFSGWAQTRFIGPDRVLLVFTLTPLRVGTGLIEVRSGTLLAADQQETNIIGSMRSAAFTIEAARVAPPIPEPQVPEDAATTTIEQSVETQEPAAVEDGGVTVPVAPQDQAAAAGFASDPLLLMIVSFIGGVVATGAGLGYLFYKVEAR